MSGTDVPRSSGDERSVRLGRLSHEEWDLLVIGGGVNGLATAWDAALRGLRVAIIDKDDWGSGTSSWSSRLIHGGLKYLEHVEFGLVYESLRDREWLLRAAPHLVKPLAFIMPFYKTNKNGPAILRLGMFLYDVLSFGKSVPNHRIFSREQTIAREPGIVRRDLTGSGVYYDAQVSYAERLSIELLLAAKDAGAVALNYAQADGLIREGGRVTGASVLDRESGERRDVRAKVTVNAAGPWIDELLAGSPMGAKRLNGGTKGTHLVVDRFPGGPTDECVYYEARSDGRQVLVIPWLDRYLIGSTDKRFTGDIDRAMPDDEEIDYILAETNTVFPDANLTRDSVAYAYTGIRPLPYAPDTAEGKVTRKHIVKDHGPDHPGLITLIGGKLTTFRTLGEHAADAVARRLGNQARSTTRTTVLPGSAASPADALAAVLRTAPALSSERGAALVDRYGARAVRVAELAVREFGFDASADPAASILRAETALAVREEQAVHLRDVLARRTMVGLENDLGRSAIDTVVRQMAIESSWDAARSEREVADYLYYIERLTRTEEGEPIGTFSAGN